MSLVPKFADGTPVENYEDAVITVDDQELKAWYAIARYMASFEDTDGDGVGNVPAKYDTLEGRKVVEDSKSLSDLLKNPNKFFFMIIGIVLAVVFILVLVILLLVKLVKGIVRKNAKKTTKKS